MERATIDSKGVLGPIGLILVALLWIMMVSRSGSPIPTAGSMAMPHPAVQEASLSPSMPLGMH